MLQTNLPQPDAAPIALQVARGELTSPRFAEAFLRGCPGAEVRAYQPGDTWAGFGSPRVWSSLQDAIRDRSPWLYADHSYFVQHRREYYRITRNAFQVARGEPDYKRLAKLRIDIKPWRRDGRHILLCPQSPSHFERFGEIEWTQRIIEKLRQYTDRPIVTTKKRQAQRMPPAELKGAWCVVTHSSAAATDALLAGIPAICTGDSAAAPYCLRDPVNVENPMVVDFDREAWAATLAANQWTLEEIARGECWEVLNRGR